MSLINDHVLINKSYLFHNLFLNYNDKIYKQIRFCAFEL